MKFIHAADLHIDSPLRGLDSYEGAPVERIRGATRAALLALVERALAEKVDLVLLAGDIYDGDWADFRTGLFFREQMGRLTRAGVRVFVARGNHDAESVITRTLPSLGGLHVFSADAAQTVLLEDLGVAVHGHSYAQKAVLADLVPGYPQAHAGVFNIGVLHTCLGGADTDHLAYAPTTVARMAAKDYDYWALGHVHKREVVQEADPRIVFPGNLQGRHAKEVGSKGCELVEVAQGRIVSAVHVPLAGVRWHQLVVDASGAADVDQLATRFVAAVGEATAESRGQLNAIRVVLEGESPLERLESREPGHLAAAIRAASQDIVDVDVWVEKVVCDLRSPTDRAAAAARPDALAEVLRLVDELTADEASMTQWALARLDEMKSLPPGLQDVAPSALGPQALREAIASAERTLMAGLGGAAQGSAR